MEVEGSTPLAYLFLVSKSCDRNDVAGELIYSQSLFISRNGGILTKITCYDPDDWVLAWYPDFYSSYQARVTELFLFVLYGRYFLCKT